VDKKKPAPVSARVKLTHKAALLEIGPEFMCMCVNPESNTLWWHTHTHSRPYTLSLICSHAQRFKNKSIYDENDDVIFSRQPPRKSAETNGCRAGGFIAFIFYIVEGGAKIKRFRGVDGLFRPFSSLILP
jgi:hypothetical protein